jgi:hypothetical protein
MDSRVEIKETTVEKTAGKTVENKENKGSTLKTKGTLASFMSKLSPRKQTTTTTTVTTTKETHKIPPPLRKIPPPLQKPIPPPLQRPIPPPLQKKHSQLNLKLSWKQLLTREWGNLKLIAQKMDKTLLASLLAGLISLLLLYSSYNSYKQPERHYTIVVDDFGKDGRVTVGLPKVGIIGQTVTIVSPTPERGADRLEQLVGQVLEKQEELLNRDEIVVEIHPSHHQTLQTIQEPPETSVQTDQQTNHQTNDHTSQQTNQQANQHTHQHTTQQMTQEEEIPTDITSLATPIPSKSSPSYAYLPTGPISKIVARILSRKQGRPWALFDTGSVANVLVPGGEWVMRGTPPFCRLMSAGRDGHLVFRFKEKVLLRGVTVVGNKTCSPDVLSFWTVPNGFFGKLLGGEPVLMHRGLVGDGIFKFEKGWRVDGLQVRAESLGDAAFTCWGDLTFWGNA